MNQYCVNMENNLLQFLKSMKQTNISPPMRQFSNIKKDLQKFWLLRSKPQRHDGWFKTFAQYCACHQLILCVQDESVTHVPPDATKRPRRCWSRRMGSLEVMIKSMLDLRQLETFGQKRSPSLSTDDKRSVSSLQETVVRRVLH